MESSGRNPKELQFIASSVAPLFGRISDLIVDFDSAEERVAFLTTQLRGREKDFAQLVAKIRKSKDLLPLDSSIRLLGAKQTHDFLIADRLKGSLEGKPIDWEKLTIQPVQFNKSVLHYALMTREKYGEDSRYQFTGFVAGLVFDILAALNSTKGVQPVRTRHLIQDEYEHAVEVGELGLKEGRNVQQLSLEKYLISAVLLKRSGRIVCSIVNTGYSDFLKAALKKGIRSNLIHIAERDLYGISSNQVSAYLCRFIPDLQQISPALLFYDYPFMLNDRLTRSDLYELVKHCVDLTMKLNQ